MQQKCHSGGGNLLLYLFIKRVIKQNAVMIEEYHRFQLHTKFYPIFFPKVNPTHRQNYSGLSVWILT